MSKVDALAYGLPPIFQSSIRTGLALEMYGWVDIMSFITGTDVTPLVNIQEASSVIEHGINSKPLPGITGSVICASLFLLNLI